MTLLGCGGGNEVASPTPETSAPTAAVSEPSGPPDNETPTATVETEPNLDAIDIGLTEIEIADGWIALFDSVSLFGWEANSTTEWAVVNGAIVSDEGNEPGLLLTKVPFKDYILRAEAKVAEGGNSGLFLRTVKQPTDPAVDCYELNLCDTHPAFPTGSLVARTKPDQDVKGDGRWLPIEVRMEGPRVTVTMDGEQVLDVTGETAMPEIGYIGLQMNVGRAEFRKIALKPLGMNDLWNGQDLTGWRVVPESETEFTVADGEIRGKGGLGFLESEQTFDDFVLQFEAKVNVAGDNSGLFFRSQAGTDAKAYNGYELQIHNEVKDGDLTQPANAGTGAIFRRTEARRVVSQDDEWFYAALVANDDQFMIWINGEPVTVWKDERAADENPRRGLRLEPGHFAIQAHDPTSDVSFRDITIGELPDSP